MLPVEYRDVEQVQKSLRGQFKSNPVFSSVCGSFAGIPLEQDIPRPVIDRSGYRFLHPPPYSPTRQTITIASSPLSE